MLFVNNWRFNDLLNRANRFKIFFIKIYFLYRLSHTPTDSGKASPASHRKSKDKDQELFDFLNSDSPAESNTKSLKPWNNGAGLSRHSSSSSIASSNRVTESASVAVPVNGQEMSRSQRDGMSKYVPL